MKTTKVSFFYSVAGAASSNWLVRMGGRCFSTVEFRKNLCDWNRYYICPV